MGGTDPISSHAANQAALARAAGGDATEQRRHREIRGAIFGSILYTQIFAGVFLGYVVFNEIPTINNYIGNLIIIAAGVYIVLREVKLKKNIVTSTARHPTIPIKKD